MEFIEKHDEKKEKTMTEKKITETIDNALDNQLLELKLKLMRLKQEKQKLSEDNENLDGKISDLREILERISQE